MYYIIYILLMWCFCFLGFFGLVYVLNRFQGFSFHHIWNQGLKRGAGNNASKTIRLHPYL